MISVQNLTFSYSAGGNTDFQFPDFACPDNATQLILGQSGRGKTTFLHLLALLLKPRSGTISVDGQEVQNYGAAQAAQLRADKIGIIYQKSHFVSSLNVQDNLLLPNYLSGKKQDKDRVKYLGEKLNFSSHLSKKTNQLSLGEQQRVSIARALMNRPSVILADEPTSSLDDENCRRVIDLLVEQSSEVGASLVVVTHDQRLKDRFVNRIIL